MPCRTLLIALSLALAGCAGMPTAPPGATSPCARSEASMECQVERYNNVNVD